MKGFVITIMLSVLSWTDCFADGARYLVVNAKDGTQMTFALTDEPRVSFAGGELSIVSNSRTFTMSIADVLNYSFAEKSSDIVDIVKSGNVKLEDGCVVFSGLICGSKVSAYMQDGRLIKECAADSNGTAFIDLSTLPKGILIFHSGKTVIKVVNN